MRAWRFVLAVPILAAFVVPAVAYPPFYNEFKKDYLDKLKDKKFAESIDKAPTGGKCLVCHQGKQKKNRNDFGKVVEKLLTKKDAQSKEPDKNEKIAAGLKKALDTHVDPKDDKSETYMDRLEASKWPGGKLEDLKKEPKKGASSESEKKE
jgi:hypothetical protein